MSHSYTVTEYDKEDIEKLENMSIGEIINVLDHIDDGWLPTNYVYIPHEDETYTESQYEATRLHKAVRNAIKILQQQEITVK